MKSIMLLVVAAALFAGCATHKHKGACCETGATCCKEGSAACCK